MSKINFARLHFVRQGVLLSTLAMSSLAFADPTCTTQPESAWIPFEQAKAQVVNMGYAVKNFKKTETNCYELYGYTPDNKPVEIYFNPVNMSIVKQGK